MPSDTHENDPRLVEVCDDPRLQSIIQNWPSLPEDIRSAVAVLVTVGQHLPDSRLEARILALLRENPAPMTRKALASRLGLEGPKGRFGERIRNLIASGLIFEHDGEVSDDPRKFTPAPCQE